MAKLLAINSENSSRRTWVLCAIAAFWISWGFGYQTVWQRLALQIDGTIISSRDVPATGAPRFATYYVIRENSGQEQAYVAGATDSSLKRSMPVGTRIHKVWGQLGYEVNGQWVAFPIGFYGAFLCLAIFLAGAAIKAWWSEKRLEK